jgi:hypothetical protein
MGGYHRMIAIVLLPCTVKIASDVLLSCIPKEAYID